MTWQNRSIPCPLVPGTQCGDTLLHFRLAMHTQVKQCPIPGEMALVCPQSPACSRRLGCLQCVCDLLFATVIWSVALK